MGYRIEELKFRRKCGYTYHTEFYRGRPIKKADMIEIFETKVGDFTESEWLELAKASILEYGQTRLYEAVRDHVSTLPWLKTETEKDIYTLECISSKAYETWENFSYQEEYVKEEAMNMKLNNANFNLGPVVMTCGIAQRMEYDTFFGIEVMTSLARYCQMDWGNLDAEDKKANDRSLKENPDDFYLLAKYELEKDSIYIITNRVSETPGDMATTILFPSEY